MEEPMDGSRVSYVGDGEHDLAIGDEGKVLSSGATGSHVMWTTGKRAGDVTLTLNWDLVVTKAATRNDSLDSGGLVTTAVRQVYERQGARGVLSALDSEGHLAPMVDLAETAIASLTATIRRDPSMREVLASLDEEEGSELVHLTAQALLREAFGGL